MVSLPDNLSLDQLVALGRSNIADFVLAFNAQNVSKFAPRHYLLLMSMKYSGSDQYLYQRPDVWACFWKGIELAATGIETHVPLTWNNFNRSFASAEPSNFPISPRLPGQSCDMPFTFTEDMFQAEAWLFQRVFPGSPQNNEWEQCRFWQDTHTFGNARAIPFTELSKAAALYKENPQLARVFGKSGHLSDKGGFWVEPPTNLTEPLLFNGEVSVTDGEVNMTAANAISK